MEIDELRQRQNMLADRVAQQEAGVRQDYRRRMNGAEAVVQVAQRVWIEIVDLSTRAKKMNASSEPKWQFGVFAFGSVLSWLLQDGDKFQPNLGWALMVVALVAWALRQYAIDSDRRELAVLRRVEQNYLLHWLSSGISDAKFWALRDAFGTRLSIERNSVDTDDWRAQGAAIGQKEAELWHDVRLDALSAAVGELIWLDTAKPIDLRGPTV